VNTCRQQQQQQQQQEELLSQAVRVMGSQEGRGPHCKNIKNTPGDVMRLVHTPAHTRHLDSKQRSSATLFHAGYLLHTVYCTHLHALGMTTAGNAAAQSSSDQATCFNPHMCEHRGCTLKRTWFFGAPASGAHT
jgi:hypothetical protein